MSDSHLDENGFVVLDNVPSATEVRAEQIAACQLCDDDGYTPAGAVCDHIDHRPAAARGMALVREALQKNSPQGAQRQESTTEADQ
jgi:hypothetical protein